jgi:hypothetical protein
MIIFVFPIESNISIWQAIVSWPVVSTMGFFTAIYWHIYCLFYGKTLNEAIEDPTEDIWH